MHIYKKKEDGTFVIDFEGDLLISDKRQIRFSDFGEQAVEVNLGVIVVNNENYGSRLTRALFAVREMLKRL
jgi:nicotinamide riboside kinase